MTQQNKEDLDYCTIVYLSTVYEQHEIRNRILKKILDLAECKSGYKGPYAALSDIKELVLKYLGEI